MIIVSTTEEKLEKSKYYDKNIHWDYPVEEIDYLIQENGEQKEKIYAITEKYRIYETSCDLRSIKNILN